MLHGLLERATELQVLLHLSACPACESLLQDCVAGRERLRATRTIRRLPSGAIVMGPTADPETFDPVPEAAQRTGPLGHVLAGLRRQPAAPRRVIAGAMAAVVAVLLVVYGLWLRPSAGPFPVAPLPVGLDAPHLRANGLSTEECHLRDGLAAYAAGDYARAIHDLAGTGGPAGASSVGTRGAAMGSVSPGGAECECYRLVYLGSALALSGRHREAANVLRPLPRRMIPDPWGSHVVWTLHESLRRSGQEQSADSLLRVLAGELGPDADRARSMLAGEPPARE